MGDSRADTPIHQAAKDGDVATLKRASKKELSKEDGDGWIPLHWAVWIGNVEAAKTIVMKGTDIDQCNSIGRTALHIASGYGQTRCMQLLVEAGANIFALDNRGQTPSLVALENGHVDLSRRLNTVGVKMQMHNPELVSRLKIKAYKDLQKRVKKDHEKSKKLTKKRSTSIMDYTERSHTTKPKARHVSESHLLHGNRKLTAVNELQNFELRSSSSAEHLPNVKTAGIEEDSRSANIPLLDGQTLPASFKPITTNLSRGMLESLKSLPEKPQSHKKSSGAAEVDEDGTRRHSSASDVPIGMSKSNSQSSRMSAATYSGNLVQAVITENDSPLSTFLQSLDIMEIAQRLYEERMDINSLLLCDEGDFTSIGLPLGPRKRLLAAIKTRREILTNPGRMHDTSL